MRKNYSSPQNLENVILSTKTRLTITYRRRTEPKLQPLEVLSSQSWGVYRQIPPTLKAGLGRELYSLARERLVTASTVSCFEMLANFQRWPWQKTKYVTIKITNCGDGERRAADEELAISNKISTSLSYRKGIRYIRLVQDSFKIEGQLGSHLCLVFEPLREPMWRLGRHLGNIGVPPNVLKPFLRVFLQGLDFLHSECGIIHTGKSIKDIYLVFLWLTLCRFESRQSTHCI